VEVTLQHGQLRSQDYLTSTSGSSPGAGQEKDATLLVMVMVTGVYSTAVRDHKIHVQHRSCRDAFPSRGYNFADRFFG